MDRDSEPVVDLALEPAGGSSRADERATEAGDSAQERAASERSESGYSGPERRAQGYLVAEIIAEFPQVDGRAPDFDRTS